jgi:hypothetical protein
MGATSRRALPLSGRQSATMTLRGRVIPKLFVVAVCSISTSGSIPERLSKVDSAGDLFTLVVYSLQWQIRDHKAANT